MKDIRERRGDYIIALAGKYNWRKGVELGVWYGQTFFRVLDALPNLHLTGVDIWQAGHVDNAGHHTDQKQNREDVLARVPGYGDRATILEMTTEGAAKKIKNGSLDFVFVDADHTVESARADFKNWLPKLKPTGWIIGHDFLFPGVNQAVKELLMPVNCPILETDETWARPVKFTEDMTTVCCIKNGDKYGPEYVNKLANMVMRNAHMEPYDFVCFTDDSHGIDPWIRCAALPHDGPAWWPKMGLYKKTIPGVNTGRILFLDLDVVITGDLDPLLRCRSIFACSRDYPEGALKPGAKELTHGNTSVIALSVGARESIWDAYCAAGKPANDPLGDQGFINERFPVDLLPEALVQSYRLHNLTQQFPQGCSVVMFHGDPKPHQCGGWVTEYWQ